MMFNLFIKEEREEAKEEGKAEGRAESVVEFLEYTCGSVPEELRKAILAEKDLEILADYLKQAARITSIEQFKLTQTQS